MRAAIATAYGSPDVVSLATVGDPSIGDHEILIEVRATTVSAGDARVRAQRVPSGFGVIMRLVFGFSRPRRGILGTECSGVVRSVGAKVTRWKPGDAVFALTGMSMGAHAELCVLREDGAVARKPDAVSFEEAATLAFGGTTALDFFRRAKLAAGERVLINGASGAVGAAAVQIAKARGAHVTAVCSARNEELVRSLGADAVIDYAREDFCDGSTRYDLVMDAVGNAPYRRSKRALTDRGRLLLVVADLWQILGSAWINATSKHRVIAGSAPETPEDVQALSAMVDARELRPVIDHVFAFDEIRSAHERADSGHKRGSVVVTVRR
jgi:NADPH:quinone reductase-like Zn-dependent oxidoreductase